MEPVTHILTGACMARSGLNRRAAYTTLAMALGAEMPDVDVFTGIRGPVASFAHHRGITHTFIGFPFEAAILLGLIWLLHRWRLRRNPALATAAPVRWGLLYAFILLALLSHIFLDFTNNYGIRPFGPINWHWFAGSFVFVFDPLLFLLLLLPWIMPALFGLIGSEVGARRTRFRGRGWALATLALIATYWSFRAVEHSRAVTIAQAQSARAPEPVAQNPDQATASDATPAPDAAPAQFLQPVRVEVDPDPINPFLWHAVTDFGAFYQLAEIDLRANTVTPSQAVFAKPERTPAVLAAMGSRLGRAYMDWSPMPIITTDVVVPGEPAAAQATAPGATTVMFRDPRFMADVPLMRSRQNPPLYAEIVVAPDGRILRESMDGSLQHESPQN